MITHDHITLIHLNTNTLTHMYIYPHSKLNNTNNIDKLTI